MTTRALIVLTAALAVLAVSGTADAAAVKPATIATSTAADFRVVVTAAKGPGGEAPSATVSVAAFRKVGAKWTSLGRLQVGRPNGFFWKVLTGPHSISQFSISASSPEQASLRLLLSPALGWSPVYRFHAAGEHLIAG